MKCGVSYCDKDAIALGYCTNHRRALKLYGDPCKLKQKQLHGLTLSERFFAYVKRSSGCWEWIGYKDPNGCGRLNSNGRPLLASRIAYLLHYGSVPERKSVLHRCDNASCVNPKHLYLGTQIDNVYDMHARGRARKRGLLGEAHHQAKLTVQAVKDIRKSKLTGRELAAKYGVSTTQVYDIRNRRSWKHID